MPETDDDRQPEPITLRVAAVLAAHQPVPCSETGPDARRFWWQCSADGCDWRSVETTTRRDEMAAIAHRHHVAVILGPVMAEVR